MGLLGRLPSYMTGGLIRTGNSGTEYCSREMPTHDQEAAICKHRTEAWNRRVPPALVGASPASTLMSDSTPQNREKGSSYCLSRLGCGTLRHSPRGLVQAWIRAGERSQQTSDQQLT